jgi:hypothetical protein
MKEYILQASASLCVPTSMLLYSKPIQAQRVFADTIPKSTFSAEIDPIVPIVLHGFSGHFMWEPKKSVHMVYGVAIMIGGELPSFVINLDSKNKDMGWNYQINQGLGLELEYYYKKANKAWFSGLQLLTQEIDLTNDNVPEVDEHRTNIGMVVFTTGYKWYPFRKQHFYLKPWAGIGHTAVLNGAFSSDVIPNTDVGEYTYHLASLSPYAALHMGFTL